METGESQTFVDFPFITLCLISCETQLQEQTTKTGCASVANCQRFGCREPAVLMLSTQSDLRHLYWLTSGCPHHFALQFHVHVSISFYTAASCQCVHTTAVSCECVHTFSPCSFMLMCPHHFTL